MLVSLWYSDMRVTVGTNLTNLACDYGAIDPSDGLGLQIAALSDTDPTYAGSCGCVVSAMLLTLGTPCLSRCNWVCQSKIRPRSRQRETALTLRVSQSITRT